MNQLGFWQVHIDSRNARSKFLVGLGQESSQPIEIWDS